jgi:hypothetical protein
MCDELKCVFAFECISRAVGHFAPVNVQRLVGDYALQSAHRCLCMQSVDHRLEAIPCAQYTQGGNTALICAAVRNHSDCVRLLMDHGADKEVKNLVRQKTCFYCFSCYP